MGCVPTDSSRRGLSEVIVVAERQPCHLQEDVQANTCTSVTLRAHASGM